jgi:putative transposase
LGDPPHSGSLAVLVTQRIQNHATRRSCADHVHGHLVPLAPVAAARDRRIATPADGVSEIGSAATHSTSRPYSLVLDFAALRFQDHWSKLSQRSKPGRPPVPEEVIRNISCANPRWGSPRIVGELHKLGIQVAKSTVEKYRVRQSTPPSPTWRAFLHNHVADLVSIDFFTVPTIRFKVLFILLVLAHDRRRVVHFNVTEHPTAHWTAQQIIEAFPWDTAPRYLLRDRDAIFGNPFQRRLESMGIEQVLTAPRSPWQNPYVERLIGSVRRDCLDHISGGR